MLQVHMHQCSSKYPLAPSIPLQHQKHPEKVQDFSYSMHLGLARSVHIHTVYDRIFSNFPAKNTVNTPYIYGSGQPSTHSIII